jgi:DNA-binding NarL/FixJ family response regulator
VAHLNARYAPCKVLVVSWDDSPEPLILEVFRNGAWGYLALSKTQTDEQILAAQILAAIRTLLGGGAVISPRLTAQVLDEISQ